MDLIQFKAAVDEDKFKRIILVECYRQKDVSPMSPFHRFEFVAKTNDNAALVVKGDTWAEIYGKMPAWAKRNGKQ